MSAKDYFVLEVDRGQGESTLAALESRLGVEIAAHRSGRAVYGARSTPTGSERALDFGSHQRNDLQSAIVALNADGLRARIGPIPLALFAPAGPGATSTDIIGHPPQISSHAVAAIKATFQ